MGGVSTQAKSFVDGGRFKWEDRTRCGNPIKLLDTPLFLLCLLRCRPPPLQVKHHKVTSAGHNGRTSVVKVLMTSLAKPRKTARIFEHRES